MSEISLGPFGKAKEAVVSVVKPLFAWVGRGDDVDDLPPGWVCFGTDSEGRRIIGQIRPMSPAFYFRDLDELIEESKRGGWLR